MSCCALDRLRRVALRWLLLQLSFKRPYLMRAVLTVYLWSPPAKIRTFIVQIPPPPQHHQLI